MPDLLCCRGCQKYDGGDFYFDGSAGLLLCADCAARQNKTPNLDPAALLALRHIALVEDKKIFSFSIPQKSMEALGRVTERYALQVLDVYKRQRQMTRGASVLMASAAPGSQRTNNRKNSREKPR